MHITLTYRPGHGVTVADPHARAAIDLIASGLTWSSYQGRWFAPNSRLDPQRLDLIAATLEIAGHTVNRDTIAQPAEHTNATNTTPGTPTDPPDSQHPQPTGALRAQIAGLCTALADLDPQAPGVARLRARLERARARLAAHDNPQTQPVAAR